MARPKRCRRICTEPDFDAFAPAGIPCAETVTLTLEEYETIRLIDLENCTHQQCAQQMDISFMKRQDTRSQTVLSAGKGW